MLVRGICVGNDKTRWAVWTRLARWEAVLRDHRIHILSSPCAVIACTLCLSPSNSLQPSAKHTYVNVKHAISRLINLESATAVPVPSVREIKAQQVGGGGGSLEHTTPRSASPLPVLCRARPSALRSPDSRKMLCGQPAGVEPRLPRAGQVE